jgi:hypothetical protein
MAFSGSCYSELSQNLNDTIVRPVMSNHTGKVDASGLDGLRLEEVVD